MSYEKNILVLAPHTDDAELGCGGSIARYITEGANVFVIVFSSARQSVPQGYESNQIELEFLNSMKVMGIPSENIINYDFPVRELNFHRQDILQSLIEFRRKVTPDIVFVPSSQDIHQDHQVVQIEGLRAFKNTTVLGYELPWNQISFSAQYFLSIEKEQLDMKWRCLKEYKTQLELERPYFTQEFIYGLSKVRGTQIGVDYAEAFEVFRVIN